MCQEKDFINNIPMDIAFRYCGFGCCWCCKFKGE